MGLSQIPLGLTLHDLSHRVETRHRCRACFNMADEEARVIPSTNSVLHTLGIHSGNTKKRKHAVLIRDYSTKTVFDTLETLDVLSFNKFDMIRFVALPLPEWSS